MKRILFFILLFFSSVGCPHGFTANWVDIMRLENGKFRVLVRYTNLEIGEYREAYMDFSKKKDAVKAFQDLAKGADFFMGKSPIHVHNNPDSLRPY